MRKKYDLMKDKYDEEQKDGKVKTNYLIIGIVFSICLLVWASLYLARAANINSWNADFKDELKTFPGYKEEDEFLIYDVYPLSQCKKFEDVTLDKLLKE